MGYALEVTLSQDEKEKAAGIWMGSVLRCPVMDIIVVREKPGEPITVLSKEWKRRRDERWHKVEKFQAEGGYVVEMQRLDFEGDLSAASLLAFDGFKARLFDASGQAVSYVRITAIRQEDRMSELSDEAFLYEMDIPDDEIARLGIRLLEVVPSASELFDNGDLVIVQNIVTASDQRRRGHAKRLVLEVLKELKRRYEGLGTIVVPLSSETVLVTPMYNAPAELRILYLSEMEPARRMFSGSIISKEAFGPEGKTICFDEGAQLNDVEMFLERTELS